MRREKKCRAFRREKNILPTKFPEKKYLADHKSIKIKEIFNPEKP